MLKQVLKMATFINGLKLKNSILKTKEIFLPSTCDSFGFRKFWGWLNAVFNKVDPDRIKEVGPDRACAEWLMRCGAFVKWKNFDKWETDYNQLPLGNFERYKIEEIDGTDSSIMHIGFPHLKGLKHVRKIKLHKCYYLDDESLKQLVYVKETLRILQISSCGNVTSEGILSLDKLHNLQELYLFDLPAVKNREHCWNHLQNALPACVIDFPSNEEMELRKKEKNEETETKP